MTNEQLIEKFNPTKGANLTAEDLETLRSLTDAQIDVLADAYPNQPTRRSYLRLYNKSLAENKQLFQLSTWQNLRNVRKYSNQKNLIPWDFLVMSGKNIQASKPAATNKQSPKKVVVDLSAKEAAAELSKNLVDKSGNAAEKTATAKPAKATPAAKRDKLKGIKSKQESGVDNSNLPADQQFSGAE